MMGRTHALAGVACLWLLQGVPTLLNPDLLAPLSLCAALGALLPDLDAAQSKIKSLTLVGVTPFAPLSLALNRVLGHRGLLHSLLGLGLTSVLLLPLALVTNPAVPLALSLGYASHLATDACTKSGIPLLYPRRQRYHLLPRPLRLTTGSAAEEAVFALLGALVLTLLLRQLATGAASFG
jgi:inner membrane protein